MGIFDIFRRRTTADDELAEDTRALEAFDRRVCERQRSADRTPLLFVPCQRKNGHSGPHVFEATPTPCLIPDEVMRGRRQNVLELADKLGEDLSADWGALVWRRVTAGRLLWLRWRVRRGHANEGSRPR